MAANLSRVGKLLELLPRINPVFVLRNPGNPAAALQLREVEIAARDLRLTSSM